MGETEDHFLLIHYVVTCSRTLGISPLTTYAQVLTTVTDCWYRVGGSLSGPDKRGVRGVGSYILDTERFTRRRRQHGGILRFALDSVT